MAPSLIWIEEPENQGWACSKCSWRFPVPPLLADPEAHRAYDRLAATKFRDHKCEAAPAASTYSTLNSSNVPTFNERVRRLLKVGYKPKDAVALALDEVALEHRNDPETIARAKADAEDFLWKLRQGLI